MKQVQGLYAQAEEIGDAWRAEHNHPEVVAASSSWVVEVFSDYIIVDMEGESYRVGFSRSGDEIVFADRSEWVEVEKKEEWIEKRFHSQLLSGDALVYHGGTIKALGNGRVGGYLVMYGDEKTLDLEGEYFNAKTNFDLDRSSSTSVYYNHGTDPILKTTRLGRGELATDEVGVWINAQLELRDRYERAVYNLTEEGKMGWSSGTSPNLIERVPSKNGKATWIKSWPLGLDASLTVIPAEPRIRAMPLKSYIKAQNDGLEKLLLSVVDTDSVVDTSAMDLTSWGPKEWAEAYAIFREVQHES